MFERPVVIDDVLIAIEGLTALHKKLSAFPNKEIIRGAILPDEKIAATLEYVTTALQVLEQGLESYVRRSGSHMMIEIFDYTIEDLEFDYLKDEGESNAELV